MLDVFVEKILAYGEHKLGLDKKDVNYYRNVLLLKLGLDKPYSGVINLSEIASLENPSSLVSELSKLLSKTNIPHLSGQNPSSIITDILGMMTPIPSVVDKNFEEIFKDDPEAAAHYLYNLSIANNYIEQSKVKENILWRSEFENGQYFEMTINVAKPEKDNKEVAKLLVTSDENKYPKCLLCPENVGYGGNATTPPRQNLRAISLSLDKEEWFLQYSPFVYYKDHIIVISKDHNPMTITPRIFSKLVAFVDLFPCFFIGSNSDLPIVGGSILNHEHFQGGAKVMPLFTAKDAYVLKHKNDRKVKISMVDWDSNVIKLESSSKQHLLDKAIHYSEKWLNYENISLGIIPRTGDTRHAAITPIVLKNKRHYVMYLILRNNRCDETYPTGIFHAHPEYHNIKKEGIGLIEQMGTFILPGRLKKEFSVIETQFYGGATKEALLDNSDVSKHHAFIEALFEAKVKHSEYKTFSQTYIAYVCKKVLDNCACFKNDTEGKDAFINFLKD